ncbi:post-GPI attachment to proteins factor 4-like [Ylistrum balloti]|uniref:post-GPI attachment to proteins factor 4-like n=1 Tax=Ylistrum balloti TaxID=509963 RepID=UPI002905E7FE|nr:post-GPI attachment to proteins factor 4-like [Ylistrum balloti]
MLLPQKGIGFSVVLFLLTVLLVALVCKDIPLSPLFRLFHRDNDILFKQASESNNLRLQKATRYFKSKKPAESLEFYNRELKGQLDIAIAIVTVKRETEKNLTLGYLVQTAAALDKIVKSQTTFLNIQLFLCNTDTTDSDHTEAEFMSLYIPMVTKSSHQSNKRNKQTDVRRKEARDYIYCLVQARSMAPKYVLMVEDDSIPTENFLDVIQHSLQQIGNRKFAYLKLFYPLKWQGFAFEISRLLELLCFGAIGGSISLVFHYFCLLNRRRKYSQNVQFTLGLLLTIVVVHLIGRQNIMTLRTFSRDLYSLKPSPACCTPAMLYPADTIKTLTNFLNQSQKHQSQVKIDLQIYNFTQIYNLPGYQIEPNLFRHVGMVSSLSSLTKDPEGFL